MHIPYADEVGQKRIYVAGPMSLYQDEDWNYGAFQRASLFLRALGHIVVNPAEVDAALWGFDGKGKLPPIMSRRRVLALDLGMILPTCDVIYMLKDWPLSTGAVAEKAVAETMGLECWYESNAVRLNIGKLMQDMAPKIVEV